MGEPLRWEARRSFYLMMESYYRIPFNCLGDLDSACAVMARVVSFIE